MDAPLSLQILQEDPAFNVSFLATLSTDVSGAAVSPVNGAVSATASDDAVQADGSSNVSCLAALSTDASGAAVSPVDGAAVNAAVSSVEEGTLAAPPTDAVGKTVPPVAGAATDTAADAAFADNVGASATPFDDTARKTLVSVTASAAGAAAASATAVGADCCGLSDRENIGISTFSD